MVNGNEEKKRERKTARAWVKGSSLTTKCNDERSFSEDDVYLLAKMTSVEIYPINSPQTLL